MSLFHESRLLWIEYIIQLKYDHFVGDTQKLHHLQQHIIKTSGGEGGGVTYFL